MAQLDAGEQAPERMSPIVVPTATAPVSERISVNLTVAEKDALAKLAHDSKLSMSSLARQYIQQGLSQYPSSV